MTRTQDPSRTDVEVLWLLQSRCNYRCFYCSYNGAGRELLVGLERARPVAEWGAAWRRFRERCGRATIYMTGSGEPTLFPDFIGLLKELTPVHYVVFDTNLHWERPELERFVCEVSPRDVRVETSFHPDYASADAFAEKAALLRDRGFDYNCRLVAHPSYLDRLDALCAPFERRGVRLVLTPFQGAHEGRAYPRDYTDEQRARVLAPAERRVADPSREREPELIRHLANVHLDSPEGRLCRTGQLYACLMPDGTVYRCQDYGMRGWDPLGDFFDEGFRLIPEPSRCRSTTCGCAYRYLVDEWRRFGMAEPAS